MLLCEGASRGHYYIRTRQPSETQTYFFLFSAVKKRNNWHRHDYTEPDDGSKPVQAGTSVFIKELQNRTFPR